jgi:S1-C subfamily serine protease
MLEELRRLHIDPTFRFHLRCALWITLFAAGAVAFGTIFLRLERLEALVEAQRGLEAENRLLSRRIDSAATRDAADRAVVENKIRALAEHQGEMDTRSKEAAKAPFSIEEVLPAIVEIVCIDNQDSDVYYTGSGVVFDESGLILTNQHLLRSDDGTLIPLCGVGFTTDPLVPPRIRYAASVELMHEDVDLAVLQITDDLDGRPLPDTFPSRSAVDLKSASLALKLGDPIFIGGYPGIGAETFTFTQGVVSGRVGRELIKTSALIDSGTSGGAAFDSSGRFVGVPTAAAKGEIGGSLGYLISGEIADEFIAGYFAHDEKRSAAEGR